MKKVLLFSSVLLAGCGGQPQPVYEPVEVTLSAKKTGEAGVVSLSILADIGFYNPNAVTIKVMNGSEELKNIATNSGTKADAVPNHNWNYRFDSTLNLDTTKSYDLKVKMTWENSGEKKSVESQVVNLAAGSF